MHTAFQGNMLETSVDKVQEYIDAIANSSDGAIIYDASAKWILYEFDKYYSEFLSVSAVAKLAFEQRNPGLSVSISKKRLSMYSESMRNLGVQLKRAIPFGAEDEELWDKLESRYWQLIQHRYEADLALAYIHSVRRSILRGERKPVAYSFGRSIETGTFESDEFTKTFSVGPRLSGSDLADMLSVPGFSAPFRNFEQDAALSADRINQVLDSACGINSTVSGVEIFNAGFFRNRGAYLVGRITVDETITLPLIIALLNEEAGIYVDAILYTQADAHNLFSSTLANFHVTTSYYHELVDFLYSIMPERPIGLHYTTIGYNHFGKVAVMNELKHELQSTGEVFETSPGYRGTVAIGFSAPSSTFNLKIIRDKPTEGYKWGTFEGVESVLKKYSRVHDINRTGSMLDNIIYYNVRLEKDWFNEQLLKELIDEAPSSIMEDESGVIFKHLIVQIKVTPLPVFLKDASPEDATTAIINLGHCIKNNAAANIFNKDLDARNYGVSHYLKVYLFDYDALENFTDVKIRTNLDRYEGEEDVPDWYFEEGSIFLPEEIESGLRIPNRTLTRTFRHHHGNLLTPKYWQHIQDELMQYAVPSVRVYPEERKLHAD